MTLKSTSSVFVTLGYQVLSLELGVYVLQSLDEERDERVVGLMLAKEVPHGSVLQVTLFLEPVPAGVAAMDIAGVWQNLNACRFEETGLTARMLELGPLLPSEIRQESYARPDGGYRKALELSTGDVVCLN